VGLGLLVRFGVGVLVEGSSLQDIVLSTVVLQKKSSHGGGNKEGDAFREVHHLAFSFAIPSKSTPAH